MRSLFCFIVEPVNNERYNTSEVIGEVEIITSVSEEDVSAANREAVVLEIPAHYSGPIKKGDVLIVHHNTFKFYNDMKGRRRSSKNFLKDNQFLIYPDEFFMYKNEEGYHPVDRYCFVEPIPAEKRNFHTGAEYEPLKGVMRYPNAKLLSLGVKPGDTIGFCPDTEYEFNIDGKKMYRMFDHHITLNFSNGKR